MKDDRLYTALDVCISAMESGVPADKCAALYPDLREELESLLQATRMARSLSVEPPPISTIQRSRSRLLAAADKRQSNAGRWRMPRLAFPRLALVALSLLIVLLVSFNGLIVASAQSLPGDTLYPVKLVAENVQLQFASNTEIKHSLEDSYTSRRAKEVHSLLQMGRVASVQIEGVVTEISPQRWIVDGIPVVPAGHVRVIGLIEIGDVIEVEGRTTLDGFIQADELHLRYFNLTGTVVAKSSHQWQVGDVNLAIESGAQIDPTLVEGDRALVLVYSSDDGKLYARAILRDTSDPLKSSSQSSEINFTGELQAMGDSYAIIDGKTISLNEQTILENMPAPGSQVHVSVSLGSNGEMTALTISAPLGTMETPGQTPASTEDSLDDQDSSDDLDDDKDSSSNDDDDQNDDQYSDDDQEDDGWSDDDKDDSEKDGDDKEDDDKDDEDRDDGEDDDRGDDDDDHEDDDDEDDDHKDDKDDKDDGGKDDGEDPDSKD